MLFYSSNPLLGPSNLIDGDYTTVASNGCLDLNPWSYFILDLGSAGVVTKVVVTNSPTAPSLIVGATMSALGSNWVRRGSIYTFSASQSQYTWVVTGANPTGYTSAPCTTNSDTVITPITPRSVIIGSKYISCPGLGSSLIKGADCAVATCTPPSNAQYVTAICSQYSNTILATVSSVSPTLGVNFLIPSVQGSTTVVGSDNFLKSCSQPGPGQFVTGLCTLSSDTVFSR